MSNFMQDAMMKTTEWLSELNSHIDDSEKEASAAMATEDDASVEHQQCALPKGTTIPLGQDTSAKHADETTMTGIGHRHVVNVQPDQVVIVDSVFAEQRTMEDYIKLPASLYKEVEALLQDPALSQFKLLQFMEKHFPSTPGVASLQDGARKLKKALASRSKK